MSTEFRFVCPLPNGVHARPASLLAGEARRFAARVTIGKEQPGGAEPEFVDLRSVLSVVSLDIREGDRCIVIADGVDAAAAIAALREFVRLHLAALDEQSHPASAHGSSRLPVPLRHVDVDHVLGRAASAGVGIGAAVVVGGLSLSDLADQAAPEDPEAEVDSARRAVGEVGEELRSRAAQARSRTERDLLSAHSEIVDDPALWFEIERAIRSGSTAPQAVVGASDRFASRLRASSSAYIRDRVIDVQDICMQLVERLSTGALGAPAIALDGPSVVFAELVTPNQLLRTDRALLRGLVLGAVGETSHTVILATTLGVPCILNASSAIGRVHQGDEVVVDGDGGFVVTRMTPEVTRYYDRERSARDRRMARFHPVMHQPAVTRDGVRLEIGVNASSAPEVAAGIAQGADGVGLFRTEFLFLERDEPPSEDEQFEVYTQAIAAADHRPIIFRAFDIGGDKPAAYLRIPAEDNPFLGVRGARLYPLHANLVRTQLRAMLRARAQSPASDVRVMAPMIATAAEAKWFTGQVREVEAELRDQHIEMPTEIPVGVMIEVPAAANSIASLADHATFFSVGTNDLCQYWMAADRGNPGVAHLGNPIQPSFLRMLRDLVSSARDRGVWIGVCGEMAGHPAHLPLMIGLGVDEISVGGSQVLPLKAATTSADAARCRELLDAACACADSPAVDTLLRGAAWRATGDADAPIVDRCCIAMDVDARSKEEAIGHAIDLAYICGRTDHPREVEEAIWAREETYSTGLGHGFAVPHCKSHAVIVPTLAVIGLASAVEWNSLDGEPVRMVLLLCMPESDAAGGGARGHMKVFATLARKLMHDEFRVALLRATSPEAVETTLRRSLGLDEMGTR